MTAASTGSTAPPDIAAQEIEALVEDALVGLGLAAAGANVIMQLSKLPVGHGVAKSPVETGRIDEHPIKRTRTTLAYLAIALTGTDEERAAMRGEVNRVHRHVHSSPEDPVAYDAFDPELQLWVAACLYKGVEDVQRLIHGDHDAETAERLYQYCSRLGTTLQVSEDQWPKDRAAFQEYWDHEVARIEMDDLTRDYLQGIARAAFLPAPFRWLAGPVAQFQALGFLPEPFRAELGLPWGPRRQRAFDAVMGLWADVDRRLPRPLRQFPFNAYRWDTRRRIRRGLPIV